jgi:hypothetical protein
MPRQLNAYSRLPGSAPVAYPRAYLPLLEHLLHGFAYLFFISVSF